MSTNNTYTWQVENVITQDQGDLKSVVTTVFYSVLAKDPTGQYSYLYRGYRALPPVADSGQFIDFNSLQETQLIDWIAATFDESDVHQLVEHLDVQLARAQTAVAGVVPGTLPWDPARNINSVDVPSAVFMRPTDDLANARYE